VQAGKLDLIVLIFIFIGLQAWWLIPLIKKNNKLNNKGKILRNEIKQLERIYKKNKWKVQKICFNPIIEQNWKEKILFNL